jgi:hypothetical protein
MTIERAVQFIKGGFAFRVGKEIGSKAPFWQKGFSEIRILDASAFQHTASYVRNNPVEAQLVRDPAEYPHSSAFPGFELDPPPQWLRMMRPPPTAAPEGAREGQSLRRR